MSFFDKLGKTVTNTAHSVVEKTKSSTETIRLNGLINDEEKNINAAYLNMGRKYAELHTADAEPEFQEFLSAIAASQEKIAEYREQIRKTKHLLICQGCGAEIPETVLYYTKCGAENPVGKQLAEERAAREAAERAQREAEAAARQAAAQAPQAPAGAECCPNCGKPRMAGAMFCTFCGNPFVAAAPTPAPAPAPAPAEQPIPQPVPTETAPVSPAPAAAPAEAPAAQPAEPEVVTAPETAAPAPEAAPAEVQGRLCPNCGNPVPEENHFCTRCGHEMTDQPAAAEPVPETPQPAAPERTCPNCGKPVPDGNRFCTSCGMKIGE